MENLHCVRWCPPLKHGDFPWHTTWVQWPEHTTGTGMIPPGKRLANQDNMDISSHDIRLHRPMFPNFPIASDFIFFRKFYNPTFGQEISKNRFFCFTIAIFLPVDWLVATWPIRPIPIIPWPSRSKDDGVLCQPPITLQLSPSTYIYNIIYNGIITPVTSWLLYIVINGFVWN